MTRTRRPLRSVVVAGVLAAGVVVAVPAWAMSRGHSEFHATVAADPTWLAYLPSASSGLDLAPIGLTSEDATGRAMRRVDLWDDTHHEAVSLCFAATPADVLVACPGSTYLGTSGRDGLDLPAYLD